MSKSAEERALELAERHCRDCWAMAVVHDRANRSLWMGRYETAVRNAKIERRAARIEKARRAA